MLRNAFLVAATAVLLAACGPSQNNANSQQPQAQTQAAPAKHAEPRPERRVERPRPQPVEAPRPAPVCQTCGTVTAVQAIREAGQPGLVGTLGGAAAGGLVGNQFGKGKGKAAMTALGAVAGAIAGREVQQHVTAHTVYRVTVRMDSGATRVFTLASANGLAAGSKVSVNGNTLSAR
ncbi:MAG TPA: glycine zipper 2TM domain-containing protein [Nevskiaceae bacterium]|nr:glycine zipper 2TM domain-containing protein [Nevskiaceae bacterium]